MGLLDVIFWQYFIVSWLPKCFGLFMVTANKNNRSSIKYSSRSLIGLRNKILIALIASPFFLLLWFLLESGQ